MISSKKGLLGSEFVLWFFRFLVVIIIVAGITFMVYAVIRKNYDIGGTETVLISKTIMDCITKYSVINIESIDDFQHCINIDEKEIYVTLSVFNSEKEIKKAEFGRKELKVFCDISKEKQKYPPSCFTQIYLIDLNYNSLKQIAYLNMEIALTNEKNV